MKIIYCFLIMIMMDLAAGLREAVSPAWSIYQ